MSRENLLLVADSEHDANMLYAVGMFVPDPFIYLRIMGRSVVVMNDLELDRARRCLRNCRVLSLSSCLKSLKREGVKKPGLPHVVRLLLRRNRVKKVLVPPSFPHGFARQLRQLRVKVKVRNGPIFAEREFKTADEVKKISAALMMAEVGLSEGIQALKTARIDRKRKLVYHSAPLTADKLRAIINIAIIQAGGLADHTIVASGRQACDPHEQGYGVLKANEPIILDVFPRSQKTGYFGDITRTVVKGRASEAVRKLYHTVGEAQRVAFENIEDNVPAIDVHTAVQKYFESRGYKSGRRHGRMEGFFHGTGHGLGLEVHEAPRLGTTSEDVLRAGHVVTVEPGLYYPAIGGVRLEDVVLVTRNSPRNLTRFEKVLEV